LGSSTVGQSMATTRNKAKAKAKPRRSSAATGAAGKAKKARKEKHEWPSGVVDYRRNTEWTSVGRDLARKVKAAKAEAVARNEAPKDKTVAPELYLGTASLNDLLSLKAEVAALTEELDRVKLELQNHIDWGKHV